jgi:hypothetical protein
MFDAGCRQRFSSMELLWAHHHVGVKCVKARVNNWSFARCISTQACNGVAMSVAMMVAVATVVPMVAAVVGQQSRWRQQDNSN